MTTGKSETSPFLKPQRLTDVLRLIEHLAVDKEHTQRSDKDGLQRTLGPPASADNWTTIVAEHPQFFENVGGEKPLVLRARHHCALRDPLSTEEIKRLQDYARGYYEDALRHGRCAPTAMSVATEKRDFGASRCGNYEIKLSQHGREAHGSSWPISEAAARLIEVRSLGHSGLDLLTLSSSRFDPLRKSARFAVRNPCLVVPLV